MTGPLILGIESSCDETGVGIVRGRELLANEVASSVDLHVRFGGVVPEVASRAHLSAIVPTIRRAAATADVDLSEIDAVAVTAGPGLVGALLVGISAAKALAAYLGKPLYGVNHLVGHVAVDLHVRFGGVVPEVASRAHLSAIVPTLRRAAETADVDLADIDAVAVTAGPGLVGALLVGVAFGKALAFGAGVPAIGVHHMEGHLFATALEHPGAVPPFTALLVSGGHTLLLDVESWGRYRPLGGTRDDAAGEAFDKVAKLLGLPYPGGPHVERLAATSGPGAYRF